MRKQVIGAVCRVLAPLGLAVAATTAGASEQTPPKPADPLTVTIQTEDAERFASLFAATGGAPNADQLQAGYLDPGSYGVTVFTPYRIRDAASLARTIVTDHASYARAITQCLPLVRQHEGDLRAIYLALAGLLPDRALPQIYLVFGAGNSGGTAGTNAQVLGLEVLCDIDPSPEGMRTTLRRFFAHETVHSLQHEPSGAARSPLLAAALTEGGADFIAAIVTGETPEPKRAAWAAEREAALWIQFRRDVRTARPAKTKAGKARAAEATTRWIGNYRKAPDGWPSEVGYWIGMRIWQSYYDAAPDKRKAIADMLAWDDPELILRRSGYGVPRPRRRTG